MTDDEQRQEAATSADLSRQAATSSDSDYSLSIEDALARYISDRLSPGAKIAYAMLLKYAWRNEYCFPGQDRLATDMGVTRQSANTYIQELQRQQFINIKRRGQGKTNLYELNLTTVRKRVATR